jgi:hypothetical protein
MNKDSTQTLRQGLEEYYQLNPHITDPSTQPQEFSEILKAHDVGHVIYACDTTMRDELKILPMFWWSSECSFTAYLSKKYSPAVDVVYRDMIAEKGEFQLILSIIKSLPFAIIEIIPIWFKTRRRKRPLPFLDYHHLLDRSLIDIRRY